jgi:hypothetical protein
VCDIKKLLLFTLETCPLGQDRTIEFVGEAVSATTPQKTRVKPRL